MKVRITLREAELRAAVMAWLDEHSTLNAADLEQVQIEFQHNHATGEIDTVIVAKETFDCTPEEP